MKRKVYINLILPKDQLTTRERFFHYRGTYLQDWIVDPIFPRVWRLKKSVQVLARSVTSRRISIDLGR